MRAIEKIDNEMHRNLTEIIENYFKVKPVYTLGFESEDLAAHLIASLQTLSHQPAPEKINEQGRKKAELDLSNNQWTAVAHKTQRGGPYTFHYINGFVVPVSHCSPFSKTNMQWYGNTVEECIESMKKSYGEDSLVIKQFDNVFDMFEWLSCPDPTYERRP